MADKKNSNDFNAPLLAVAPMMDRDDSIIIPCFQSFMEGLLSL
jgi:hypothetical protein